ncbi:hypothetical protein J2X49_002484 [Agrococcus sp. BE272]|nr:hypothetical protein [Agrococcus sp. BE272]
MYFKQLPTHLLVTLRGGDDDFIIMGDDDFIIMGGGSL